MAKSSSFAGNFDEDTFRSAVYNTMLLGMPDSAADCLVFKWNRTQTFTRVDSAGQPFDWTATAATDQPGNPDLPDVGGDQGLTVPYALEFSARPAGSANTVLGEIDTSRAVVTVIDSDYEKIKTADYSMIGPVRYRIQFQAPPQGLFGVTVYTLYLETEDNA